MNKKIYKTGLCFVGANILVGSAFIPMQNTYIAFAKESVSEKNITQSKSQVLAVADKAVSGYGLGSTYNEGFAAYLSKNGITKSEYKQYIEGGKKYKGKNVEKVYEVENLMYLFDQVVYTHPVVKNIYEGNKAIFNVKDSAWENLKKGSIYDIEWLAQVFEESLEFVDMEKVYKYVFKKVPTERIKTDLSKKDTIKYGLYSGLLGKELTEEERNKIKAGKGYELLDIDKEEYDAYKKYISLKEKILLKEVSYIKETLIHKNVRDKIKKERGIDVYSKITPKERLSVYNVSLNNYNYDEATAKKSFELLLMHKGYIKKPVDNTEGITEGAAANPVEKEKNPIVIEGNTLKEYGYLDKEQPKYDIFGTQYDIKDQISNDEYTAQYYYGKTTSSNTIQESISNKLYGVRVGEDLIFTEIKEKEEFTDDLLLEVMKTVFEESGLWKIISSKEEHLIFANNKIQTIKIKEKYSLKQLNKKLKKINVEVVLMKAEDVEKIKSQENKLESEKNVDVGVQE